MYDQTYAYLNKVLCLDKGEISGALLTELSKVFDCLLNDILIAKLAAYTTLWFLYKATSLKINKEPKLTTSTALILILTYYMVFYKVLY